jgi:hypothetical protein
MVMDRRKNLLKATMLIIIIGMSVVAYVGMSSLYPSEAIESNRILKVNIKSIPLDSYRLFNWNGIPVMIFRPGTRSKEYLVSLNNVTNGADFTTETFPEFFAYKPVSTYKECWLSDSANNEYFNMIYQGWYDPCHMGFWDYSGRNLPGVNVPSDTSLPNLKAFTDYKWVSNSDVEFWP